jgi:hypothetical protein
MTCIVAFPTKKALRQHIERHQECNITDPSIVKPFCGDVTSYLQTHKTCVVTNHPKRSYFATIRQRKDGKLVVT